MSLSLAGSGEISGFDAGLSGFGGLVQTQYGTFKTTYTTNSSSWVAVPGFSVSITPTSGSNLLRVSGMVGIASQKQGTSGSSTDGRTTMASVFRDGTNLVDPTSPGNRDEVLYLIQNWFQYDDNMMPLTWDFIVSATSTSTTTFDVRGRSNYSPYYVRFNRSDVDNNIAGAPRGVGYIIVQEIIP